MGEATKVAVRIFIGSSPSVWCDIDVLLLTIAHIINASLSSGSVPLELNTAVVKPLLKKTRLSTITF